jgi:hypothetical protein
MFQKWMFAAVLIVLSGMVLAGNNGKAIYRWVDEAGKVHYGDTVPGKYRDSATRKPELKEHSVIDVEGTAREQEARQKAREVLDRDSGQNSQPAGDTAEPEVSVPAPAVSENTADMTCEEQWQRYSASQACFALYRLANGAVRPEAFDNCVEVPRPPRCE